MNSTLILLICAALLAGCAQLSSRPNHDAGLIGNWTCVSAVVDGKPLPSETAKALRLSLTGTRYITVKGTETLFDSSYRVDRSKHPAQIFMLGNEGDLTGKEAQGLYAIDGDTLRICYAMPGDPAPATFESREGSKAYFIVWRCSTP